MKDPSMASQAFIDEISTLKQKIKELEQSLSESRQIAGALEESEAKFKDVIDTMEDLYYQTDSEGIIRVLSSSLCRLTGWNKEDLLGKPVSSVYMNPDDRERLLGELSRKGRVHDYELVLKRKDGKPIHASLSARPIIDENGRQSGVSGLLRDVTGRKLAEEKLKKQTDAIEASMDGIAILNEDQRYVYLNKSHARIYGYDTPGDLLGRSWRVLYDTDELQRFDHYIMPEFTQKGSWQGEATGRKKDGTAFYQEISLTALDDGGLICVVRDITERKLVEEKIKAARVHNERVLKFNEALLSAIPTPVFYKDRKGRYLGCNRAFTEIMGVTSEEIAGKTVMELWPGEHAEVYHAKDLELLNNPERQAYEFKVRDKAGIDRTVIFVKDVFRDEHGQPAGIVGSFLDITGHKRAEEALRESEERQKTILSNVGASIFLKDTRYRYTFANNEVCALFGVGEDEIIGKDDSCFFTASSVEEIMKSDRRVIEQGETVSREETNLVSSDKVPRTYWTVKLPLRDSDNNICGLCGISTDITALKRIREDLATSEETFRSVVNKSPMGIHIYELKDDDRLVFVRSNPAADRMTGADNSRFIGKTIEDAFPPLAGTEIAERYRRAARDGESWYTEQVNFEYGRIKGAFEVHAFQISQGRVAVLFNEITEQRRIEQDLREKTEELDRYFTTSLDLFCIADTEGYFRRLNPQWETALGYRLDELEGKRFLDFVHPDDLEATIQAVSRLEAQEQIFNFTNRYRCRDGSYRWIEWRSIPSGKTIFAAARDITERKLAEEALRDSEEKYRRLIENASEAIFVAQDNKMVFVNGMAVKIIGYSRQELMTRPFVDFIYPEDRDMVVERHLGRLRGEEVPDAYPFRIVCKDGRILWGEVRAIFIEWEGRKATLNFFNDITERRQAEEVLRMNESRTQALLRLNEMSGMSLQEVTDFGLEKSVELTKSTVGYLAFLDNAGTVLTMHSWSQNALQGCTIAERPIIYPLDTTGLWGEPIRQRKPVITNDYSAPNPLKKGYPPGHVPIVRHLGVPIFEGDRIVALVGVGNKKEDYTESDINQLLLMVQGVLRILKQKADQEALSVSESRLRAIIESARDSIFIKDKNLRYAVINPAMAKLFDTRPEEVAGKSDADLFGSDIAVHSEEIDRKVLQGETVEEERVKSIHNTIHVFHTVKVPLKNDAGEVVGICGIARDISERKRLEVQLVQAQKTEAIGTLAGGIAHDFNNILTSLMGYTTLMQMKMDKDSPLQPYVGQIMKASKKAADLTKSLLTFSRQQPVTLVPLDMNTTIEETQKLLKRLLTEDIDLKIRLSTGMPVVMADKTQIDQILFNLVTNARDAMPGGGVLTIETSSVRIDDDFVSAHGLGKGGKYLRLTVADTGTGMDSATVEKIFDPFFTTKEVGKGTGLGLATVYGIVKQHNGFITVESQPEQGTAFHVFFPTVTSTVDATEDQMVPVKTGKEKILIAEDNNEVRFFIREALREHGYTTIEAVDGEDAVETFKKHRDVALVIIDSVMPKKNGRQVYEEIRGIVPGIKTLFTSGYTKDIVLDKGVEEKEFDFIAKPVSLDTLLEKVRDILDRE